MKIMNVTNHSELVFRIMELKAQKLSQEIELKYCIKEFAYTVNPTSMIKNSIYELSQDKEVRIDLTKVGFTLGANFIIDKVLGRNRGIKGFLSSVLFEKVSSTLINKYAPGIVSGFRKLINSRSRQNNE